MWKNANIRLLTLLLAIALSNLGLDGHRTKKDAGCSCESDATSTDILIEPTPHVFVNQGEIATVKATCLWGKEGELPIPVEAEWLLSGSALTNMEVSGIPSGPASSFVLQFSAPPWTEADSRWAESRDENHIENYLFLKATPTSGDGETGGLGSAEATVDVYKRRDGDVNLSREGVTISVPSDGSFDFFILDEYDQFVKPDVRIDGSQVTVSLQADPNSAPPDNLYEVLTGVSKRCYVEPTLAVVVKDPTGKILMHKAKSIPVEIPCPNP